MAKIKETLLHSSLWILSRKKNKGRRPPAAAAAIAAAAAAQNVFVRAV